MISNFNEVEKSLKRCLKEKVSITTATVVGFLIAGTVAFGGDVVDTESYNTDSFKTAIEEVIKTNTDKSGLPIIADKNFNGVKYVYDGEGVIERLITVTKGTTTLDKDTNISTEKNVTLLNIVGQDSEKVTSVTNNGTLTSTNKDWRPTVIVNGFKGNTSFTNSGTITKEGHPTYNCAVDLSSGEGYTTTFTNTGIVNGLIKSDNDSRQLGDIVINLKDTSKINGEFSFDGAGKRIINIDSNTDDLTINNENTNDTLVRTNNSDITLRGKIQSKETTVELNNKVGDNTLTNYAEIIGKTGIGVANSGQDTDPSAENRTVKIINNGKVTASVTGIYNNGYYTKLNKIHIENNGDVLVNDFEKTTNGGKPYYYNTGIYSASNQDTKTLGKVVNNGNITIELSSKKQEELKSEYERTDGDMYLNIYGLRLHEHTEGYNNGEILINSYGGIGVVLSASDGNGINTRYGYFENNETVEVNGENGIGVKLNSKNNSIIESINTEKGSIAVSGKNVIGVRVEGESATFTNDGIITLKDGTTNGIGISIDKGTATNNGTIALGSGNLAIKNVDGTAKNAGKIKITDKTAKELENFDISTLFDGKYTHTGMIVDKDGIAIKQEEDVKITGNTDAGNINNAGNTGSNIDINEAIIKGSNDSITVDSLNVTGNVTIANDTDGKSVEIEGTTTNLDTNGKIVIGDSGTAADLKITGGKVNAEEGTAVIFENAASTLTLAGTTFNGNIGSGTDNGTLQTTGTNETVITGDIKANTVNLAGTTAITGNIETTSMAVTAGETKIDGRITGAETIKIGTLAPAPAMISAFFSSNNIATVSNDVAENATVTYSADSAIIGNESEELLSISNDGTGTNGTTVTIEANGMLRAQVDNDGNNLFGNSANVNVVGQGTIQFLTSNINKQTLKLDGFDSNDSGSVNINVVNIIGDDFYSYNNGTLTYDFEVNNEILADISSKSFIVHNVLSQDPNAREAQFDYIYSNNVYSETVKMAMDTLRMNEDAVLSLGVKPEEGQWTAQGKILFSRTEYDRNGVIRDYGVETKTTGLLGAVEYGLSEKSSLGFAFSGTKQDLDMKNASADGDAFYFGVYGKHNVNNFKLTAGLGYQLDRIDADNDVIVSTGDKYDSKAFSGYAQGKYVINAGNNVTVEPKVKLALTRLTQDSVKDKHFEMEKVKATTFDTEVGVDLIKSIKLETGKMNLLAGISYTRSIGDTDDKFKGNFVALDGEKGERFNVLGANLGENTLKINIGAEVEKDNGFFYNGGLNYKFDNEDRETFGATIGAGYKF